ncbi:hypothetical protein N7492_002042 [Penicillium capsulatum]|uniref:Involucrin repeat protein n=1 Tax=Penicillium capsulatum TaxID=69766 RepID=A0A9W9IJD9_9EURO|nr:hypothetical protein N7492_002042 [Penicillium capsulatum]
MPAAAESSEDGDSGFESSAKGAAIAAAGLALGGELIHQRHRSRSTSPPAVDKALDLTPRSQSRPSSPETSRENQSPRSRRMSTARSTNESPTAVPLHFRRPPLSPGLQRSTPAESPTVESPGSPTQSRHRRPNSVEFRHSREIRPLWLVERHSSAKAEPEVDEPLPSLPSSKTSSRATSSEDLRALNDEDAVRSWEPADLGPSLMERRRAAGLSISASRANEDEEDPDLLGSQQATPTAENFEAPEGSAKKEKPKYEFHSPSELLRDPDAYPELPSSPAMEGLPSAEGSMVGSKGLVEGEAGHEQDRSLDAPGPAPQHEADTPTQEKSSFFDTAKGAGFAGVVDAAVAAAVTGDEQPTPSGDRELPTPSEDSAAFVDALETNEDPIAEDVEKPSGFANIVDAAVAAEVARNNALADQESEEPVSAIEKQPPQQIEVPQSSEETTKELPHESAEPPTELAQPAPTEEPVVEEPAITQFSKKKKNKKKGKKGQSSQSDSANEPPVTVEEHVPGVEAVGDESRSVEPEVTPAVEQDAAQPEPIAEPAEASRDLDPDSLPTSAPEPVEPSLESTSTPAEPEAAGTVEVPEPQLETTYAADSPADNPADAPAEPEQVEDAASLSKKAKRDKKKQKKKNKNASTSEQAENAEQVPEAAAPAEETQGEQKDIVADTPRDIADVQDVPVVDASAPVEQEGFEAARDTVEATEPASQEPAGDLSVASPTQETPAPTEDSTKPVDDSATNEPPASETHELDLSQSAEWEVVEKPQLDSAASEEPTEEPVDSMTASDNAAPAEKPAEPEDTFHEAVEEQDTVVEASTETPSEASRDITLDAPAPAEVEEPNIEETPVEQPKKGKKSKKNRKSAVVEETQEPPEPKPASELEPEPVSEEAKPEESVHAEPADIHVPLAGGEMQPSETEQPVQDASEPPVAENPVAAQEPEIAPPPPAELEPASASEPVEPTEQPRELPADEAEAAAEPESEVPMTAAQKKKAKKDKKKKKAKQQSVSSIPEEDKPAQADAPEAAIVEPQPTEPTDIPKGAEAAPVDVLQDTIPAPEEVAIDVAPPEEDKNSIEFQQAGEEASKPENSQEAAVDTPVEVPADTPVEAERALVEPEAPQEKPESEQAPAEPEVPMTAAEKRKAKKAKKKQQTQQQQEQPEASTSVPENEKADAIVSVAGPEAVESTKETTPMPEAEMTAEQDASVPTEAEPVDSVKDIDAAPQAEVPAADDAPVPTTDSEPVESKDLTVGSEAEGVVEHQKSAEQVDAEPVEAENVTESTANVETTGFSSEPVAASEDVSTPADVPQDSPQEGDTLQSEQPKEDDIPATAVDAAPVAEAAETPREEPELSIESEANMTAAQKKKAKKEKKKQQKRQSEQLDTPPVVEAEASSEQKDAEKAVESTDTPLTTSAEHSSEPTEPKAGEDIATEEPVSEPKPEHEDQAPASTKETAAETAPIPDAPADAETTQQDSTEPMPIDETSSDSKDISGPVEEPAAPAELPVEAPAAQEPATPMSKKEKKKKKKRQSLAIEEEQQAEPVKKEATPEPAKDEIEPTEPTSSEKVEEPPALETAETPATTEEPHSFEEPVPEESNKEVTASDPPTAEAEVPMTAAQKKKAKKDKKKRKSVAWEDESSAPAADENKPDSEPSAPVENVESQGAPAPEAALSAEGEQSSEAVDTPEAPTDKEINEPVATAAEGDVSTQDTSVPVEEPESLPPSGEIPTADTQESSAEPEASEPSKEEAAKELEAEPAVTDEQPQHSVEQAATSDEKPLAPEEVPVLEPETEEQAAEAGLSGKERRKLKKKEKKKGKSVDLTQEPSSLPNPSQEAEVASEAPADLPQTDAPKATQDQDAITTQPEATEPSKAEIDSPESAIPSSVETQGEQTIDTPEPVPEAEEENAPGATQPVTSSKEIDETNQQSFETNDAEDKPSAQDASTEPERAAAETTEAVAELEIEASMSAAERRKAKKKEKKRQSKNVDADDDATTTEPTNDSTLPAAADANETAVPAETGALDTSGPVTAPSPAEDDGKEHQSHDIPTPDTPAKDITSTDQVLSSQVEQPQLESRSSDYPPQPVPERDFDSGEKGSDLQKEENVVDVQEPEISNESREVEDGEAAKEEKPEESAPEVFPAENHTMKEVNLGNETAATESTGRAVEEKPVDVTTEEVPDATVSAGEQIAEEPAQTTLSKKQKKKDKKKKNQKQDPIAEETPAPEPATKDKEQPEDLPAAEETGSKEIAAPEPITEHDPAPVVEEPLAEPTQDVDAPVPHSTEEAEPPIEFAEQDIATPETQRTEDAPLSRKLSKKEKKKQRQALLAAVARPEEEQTSAETVDDSNAGQESENAPNVDDIEQQATKDVSEPFAQASDEIQSVPVEIDEAPTRQDDSGKEVEQLEPSVETQPQESKPETEATAQPQEIQPVDPAPADLPEDTEPAPQEEQAATSKKMSKKEKKRAAAAAVAAAAETEEQPSQPEPEVQGEPATEGTDNINEDVKLDGPSHGETEQPVQNEQRPQELSEPKNIVAEAPEQSTEVPIEEKKQEEVLGNVVEEPISRKMSKKEKRKAKKQGKQEPTESAIPAGDEALGETTQEPEVADQDNISHPEPAAPEESKGTAPDPEPIMEDPVADVSPEVDSKSTDMPPASEPEQLDEATRPDERHVNPADAIVSDPVDNSLPVEPGNEDVSPEVAEQGVTGELVQESAPEQQDEEEKKETGDDERALEKPADMEAAGDVPQDRFLEPEHEAPISRKMSKKEKRKAKKGAVEEAPTIAQENVPESIPMDSQEEAAVQEPPTEVEPVLELSTGDLTPPVESDSRKELTPEFQTDQVEHVPVVEPEAPVELQTEPEQTPAVLEPTPEEETALSRKASKKAKKAKKASQAVDVEPTAVGSDEKQEPALATEQATPPESQEHEASDSARQETKHDDEWPTIEWEHGKSVPSDMPEPPQESAPEPEPQPSLPAPHTIEEFDESAIPTALQESTKEPEAAVEEESWSAPLSKKDKKRAKKSKKKSEQPSIPDVETLEEPLDKKPEMPTESPLEESKEITAPKEVETEPPVRTLTPGGSKIASIFPGLERGGFRRAALDTESRSVKDSAEDETAEDLEANRDIAIPVSEAPQATIETQTGEASPEPAEATRELFPTPGEPDASTEDDLVPKDESTTERGLPAQGEDLAMGSNPAESTKEPSSVPVEPSTATDIQESSSSRQLLPSQMEIADGPPCDLQRKPSVVHGRHEQTPRTWNLEEPTVHAVRAPSPPRSLFGGPFDSDALSRPRTPLDTIAEQEPVDGGKGTTARHGTPRLEIKPEHVLPRPTTPVRKFTDNALARERWPTPDNEQARSLDHPSTRGSPVLETPEQGMPVLKPSSSKGKLRHTNRSASGDLRAVSQALDSQPPGNLDLDQLPSSSSYDPVTDKGKGPARNMPDVYAWGETPSSPRSPSRPPSVRRRRSMQHLQDIETRLDQLISENRLLIAARDEAEDRLRNASVARRKSDQALNTRGADLRDKEAEVEQLKNSVEWLQKETTRLTHENEGLTASNAALAAAHAAEVHKVRESSTRELDDLRSQHTELSSQMDDRVRQEIESALAQKDTELRRLRQELEDARDKVKELQQQISASVHDNALVFRDEDYFDAACQKLCGHVQQWVLRFSKHSDHRRCRALSELHDDKIADRFDNALLDGSDADAYLGDRVRRRDVFMSVVMTMVWEYIFTRYLFGMDREQRQKLKSLEKQLGEVGPSRAVHRWRATTLTLLSRRAAFASQRQSDTEAVALEIFGTLSRVLPPPTHVEGQLLESLRKVLRVAVNLSLEMRTQLAEFSMLPPLQPEYDTNGDLARQVFFNAALMNERSGETSSNDELESQQAVVRIVLFPLVVKKGNDVGEGDDEVVVCPAQVLVARPGKDKKVSRMMSGDRMSVDASRSVYSVAPSVAPSSMMDTSNVI